ncbi:hypothetical protein HHK36_016891 [Tetracentron sinense]|uniref:Late embryogenesis abundant protein LEA-2 subgroup domain-containing protein n=1 Tax=Tetracentron sinense TaxID=13715 RepID=A0A834Z253_TETSI|nr:hypothetical protein HHK36_016891 [Tetracentron sinense]
MSAKDCGNHGSSCRRKRLYKRICAGLLIFNIIILFIILLVFLILRPTKPRFTLQDATVYAFNVSSPNLLTSNIQVTVSSRNPNDKIGIYYDKLDVYASYRNQQITLATVLPQTYQGHKDINVWSPYLYGTSVPVAPYLAVALSQDQTAGMVLVNIKIDGRVRWKVGTWISGRYHLYVNCPAYITFGSRSNGIPVGPAMKYQLVQGCSVDV